MAMKHQDDLFSYKEKMELFLKSNQGSSLQSDMILIWNAGMERRIGHRFEFPDYTALELAQIVDHVIRSRGFRTACTQEEVAALIEKSSTPAQRSLLNGGIADLLVPTAVNCLNQRLDELAEGAQLVTIELCDLERACETLHWPSA